MFRTISMKQLENMLDERAKKEVGNFPNSTDEFFADTGKSHQFGDFILLDVREPDEYRKNHLRGAQNLPYEELEQLAAYGDDPSGLPAYDLSGLPGYSLPALPGRILPGLPRHGPIVVYCSYGSRSMMAARILDRLGYEVINTAGGLAYYRGRHLTG